MSYSFEYSFFLPSGVVVFVHFLADRPDLAPAVASACFSEWNKAIVTDFGIHTEEEYTQDILTNKMNTQSPFILVAHTAEVRKYLGKWWESRPPCRHVTWA